MQQTRIKAIYELNDHYTTEPLHIYHNLMATIRQVSRELKYHNVYIKLEDQVESYIYDMYFQNKSTFTIITTFGEYNITISIVIVDLLKKDGTLRKQKVLKKTVNIFVNCSKFI
jgi:hypothetical protein